MQSKLAFFFLGFCVTWVFLIAIGSGCALDNLAEKAWKDKTDSDLAEMAKKYDKISSASAGATVAAASNGNIIGAVIGGITALGTGALGLLAHREIKRRKENTAAIDRIVKGKPPKNPEIPTSI